MLTASFQPAAEHTVIMQILVQQLCEALLCGAAIAVYAAGMWTLFDKKWPHALSRRDVVFACTSTVMMLMATLVRHAVALTSVGRLILQDSIARATLVFCISQASQKGPICRLSLEVL